MGISILNLIQKRLDILSKRFSFYHFLEILRISHQKIIYFQKKSIWQKNPALFYGLFFYLGVDFVIACNAWVFFPLALLCFSIASESIGRLVIAILVFFSASLFTFYAEKPLLSKNGVNGVAIVNISSVKEQLTKQGKKTICRGRLLHFYEHEKEIVTNASFSLYCTSNQEIPSLQLIYQVNGCLKNSQKGEYFLKVASFTPWIPVQRISSLAEYRNTIREKVQKYIASHIPSLKTADFLSGLLTGEFRNQKLSLEFKRFGLIHLMAISGFHFTIIAMILSYLISPFFNKKSGVCVLIVLLTAYTLFLGASPSILRAWIMSLLFYGAHLVNRESNGLNSLGVALIVILCMDPYASQNLGFQFSFIVTAAILMFVKEAELGLIPLFPKRSLSEIGTMGGISQHGYILVGMLRQGFALMIAVSLVAIPVTLYFFQTFPLLGLIYNLFFPALVSISMLLLLLGCLTEMIPFASNLLHHLNQTYTTFILDLLTNVPDTWDIQLKVHQLSKGWLVAYLSLLFFMGMQAKEEQKL